MAERGACPLCHGVAARPAWAGTTWFEGREFPYVECGGCGSLYCDPMPDDATVARMYGTGYVDAFAAAEENDGGKQPERVLDALAKLPAGTFVDWGCGQGGLVAAARDAGWNAIGVELDEEVARDVRARRGLDVRTGRDAPGDGAADVLHLGDVIEHLTDLDRQLPDVLRLLRPGGLLLAQGPLEANASLFTWTLKLARRLRPFRRVEMPPYHVILATAGGQRTLFRRLGLAELDFAVSEVAWPAPPRFAPTLLRRPRAVALYCLRRASQAVARTRPAALGNRYFYAGRKPAQA